MRDQKLDLIRGVSALLVLMGHARNFLMVDSTAVSDPSLWSKAFYFLTSLHHPSVMVFFVLSGYFVGGSVLVAIKEQRFSWLNYGLARLSRLWVVLLPALLLTLIIDGFGHRFAAGAYRGEFHSLFNSGPKLGSPGNYSPLTFFGNLGFLQTIQVPVFGTNGPLWSLAFEFWYYVLFPLALGVLPGSSVPWLCRIGCLALLLSLFGMLPAHLLLSGLVWLMGVAVWLISRLDRIRHFADSWLWKLGGGVLFAVALVGVKVLNLHGSDFIIGAAFAIWMPALLGKWKNLGWWSSVSFGLSEISFSLYIIHFPIQFFIASTLVGANLLQPSTLGLALFAVVNVSCIIVSVLFWWLFENRTHQVRKWIVGFFIQRFPKAPNEGPTI